MHCKFLGKLPTDTTATTTTPPTTATATTARYEMVIFTVACMLARVYLNTVLYKIEKLKIHFLFPERNTFSGGIQRMPRI